MRRYLKHIIRYYTISYFEMSRESSRDFWGIWWTPISFIILCSVLAFLFLPRSDTSDLENFLYVYIGFTIWMTLNKGVMTSCSLMPSKMNVYFQNNITFAEAIVICSLKCLFVLLTNLPFIFIISLFNNNNNYLGWISGVLLLLGLLIGLLFGIFLFVSIICAIYKKARRVGDAWYAFYVFRVTSILATW